MLRFRNPAEMFGGGLSRIQGRGWGEGRRWFLAVRGAARGVNLRLIVRFMGPCCAKSTIPRMHKWRPSIFAALHFASLPGNECHLLDVDSEIKGGARRFVYRARRLRCTVVIQRSIRWRKMEMFFFCNFFFLKQEMVIRCSSFYARSKVHVS